MKNQKQKQNQAPPTESKTASTMLALIGEHLDAIRPCNKPADETINASGKASSLVNSAMGVAKVAITYARLAGLPPDLRFLGFSMPEKRAISE